MKNCEHLTRAIASLWAISLACPAAFATDFFVDNISGSNAYDGKSAQPTSEFSGPVATINHALKLAKAADRIIIAKTDQPYRESFSVTGRENSGIGGFAFHIIGNGIELRGDIPVPRKAWIRLGDSDLWKFTPYRKGTYQLLLTTTDMAGVATTSKVQEVKVPPAATALPKLADGQWAAFRGSIYYQSPNNRIPTLQDFSFSTRSVGITIYKARDVIIEGINVRYFRLDGVQAVESVQNVVLKKVHCENNARAGVHGRAACHIGLDECHIRNNGLHSMLLGSRAAADTTDKTTFDKPPTVMKP